MRARWPTRDVALDAVDAENQRHVRQLNVLNAMPSLAGENVGSSRDDSRGTERSTGPVTGRNDRVEIMPVTAPDTWKCATGTVAELAGALLRVSCPQCQQIAARGRVELGTTMSARSPDEQDFAALDRKQRIQLPAGGLGIGGRLPAEVVQQAA